MESPRHLDLGGIAQGSAFYTGEHRDIEPVDYPGDLDSDPYGKALGTRYQIFGTYGVDYFEERGNNDPHNR